MNAQGLLLLRIESLLRDLAGAKQIIASQSVPWPDMTAAFVKELREEELSLEGLRGDVRAKIVHPDASPGELWRAWDGRRENCARILRESLALIQGISARIAGAGNAVCLLAESLLAELSEKSATPWRKYCMVADGEWYGGIGGFIHTRFPASDIWDTPVVAHEFGHVVADRLNGKIPNLPLPPNRESSGRQRSCEQLRDYMLEMFADAFGVYTLGLAFTCSCLLLRFNPALPFSETDGKHPADHHRAILILEMMKHLEGDDQAPYMGVVSNLRTTWNTSLENAAQQPVDVPWAEESAHILYHFFRQAMPDANYLNWAQGMNVGEQFLAADPDQSAGYSVRDILNGAWYARLRKEELTAVLGRRVLERFLVPPAPLAKLS